MSRTLYLVAHHGNYRRAKTFKNQSSLFQDSETGLKILINMKKILLSLCLLFSGNLLAITTNLTIDESEFQGKQIITLTEPSSKKNFLAIHASTPTQQLEKDDIEHSLDLETRKILINYFSEKPELKNKEFTLDIKELTHYKLWKKDEDDETNLISIIDEKNIIINDDIKKTHKSLNEAEQIQKIASEDLTQNSVDIIKLNNKNFLASVSTQEIKTNTPEEKVIAYQITTRQSQAALVKFIHGDNISSIEKIKTISIEQRGDGETAVRKSITNFEETLRSIASGALSKATTQCWDKNKTYYCVSLLKLDYPAN